MKFFILLFMVLEVFLTVWVGSAIGIGYLFLEMLFSAFVGAVILMNFKQMLMGNLMAIMQGSLSIKELFAHNLLRLLSGIFLVIPGVLSDSLGVLFQVLLFFSFLGGTKSTQEPPEDFFNQNHTNKGEDDVIDVEIVEHTVIK